MDVSCVALIEPVSLHFPHGPVDQKHTARFTNKETEAGRGMSYARACLELRSLLHFTCGFHATASPPPWPLRTLKAGSPWKAVLYSWGPAILFWQALQERNTVLGTRSYQEVHSRQKKAKPKAKRSSAIQKGPSGESACFQLSACP